MMIWSRLLDANAIAQDFGAQAWGGSRRTARASPDLHIELGTIESEAFGWSSHGVLQFDSTAPQMLQLTTVQSGLAIGAVVLKPRVVRVNFEDLDRVAGVGTLQSGLADVVRSCRCVDESTVNSLPEALASM